MYLCMYRKKTTYIKAVVLSAVQTSTEGLGKKIPQIEGTTGYGY